MIKGVSYFGVRSTKLAHMDLVHIKEAGYNAILHTWSEEDLQYYYDTMKQIVNDSAAMGLSVYVNPWGVGRVFGGEAYSELTARNHDMCQVAIDGKPKVAACPNHPEFRAYMHKWIATICDTNVSTIFWDEPHFYFEKGGLSNWSCRCEKCRAKFRTKFGYEMPAELTDDVKQFREESLRLKMLKRAANATAFACSRRGSRRGSTTGVVSRALRPSMKSQAIRTGSAEQVKNGSAKNTARQQTSS